MGKFSLNKLPQEQRIQMIGEFYDVIDCLRDRKEIRLFFKDLLTADEIATLMRRIEVAALLAADYTYEQIAQTLGVGRGKITNVQKSLSKSGDGYKIAIKRLLEKRKKRLKIQNKKENSRPFTFERLKQKYPLQFLLFNIIDEISEKLDGNKLQEKKALLSTPSRRPTNSTID
ncbi:MAG: hypothetical protein A2654_02615 [Candidatus Nealsonbacteria bacterium RIFCSPHIGHO2_01_FULL_43_31]|nr:MAG: hypothetical protein A2654_02615 [Candidatus Nealsonbacteria bacterium RIFCSPHIGHO2_01_FULL_43_31]OGZ21333.1 MAG: hypothetical protein A3D46_02190 [Candidatus Nealsonbacteria bacterium RIFCSPHIGHO2_02_FULL_43_13]OGZ24211.1 MAG: hypothetical protein A2922_01895 [Candidatus Nealsonbacteria bacterium RIFCSPLOWO2_01_FULL_43_36]